VTLFRTSRGSEPKSDLTELPQERIASFAVQIGLEEHVDDGPQAFWSRLETSSRQLGWEGTRIREGVPHDTYERRLRYNFGNELKELFLTGYSNRRRRFTATPLPLPEERLAALANVGFLVDGIRYGSLEFEVTVVGLQRLLELMGGPAALDMYLRQYVPLAFEAATGLVGAMDDVDIHLATDLITQASAPGWRSPATPAQRSSMFDNQVPKNSFRYWAVANFSLVPAVLLAALILYVAYQDVSEQRREAQESVRMVLDHQRALLERPVVSDPAGPQE
jgi:hypothetical protein